jgi:transaldolase
MNEILNNLKIKIFADGANLNSMLELYRTGYIKGFTTNPTLMKKDGVRNYEEFAKSVLEKITDMPISFEVFADDFDTMELEAKKIFSWGKNVYVKIPITNTKGESSINLIRGLSSEGLSLNITAMLTLEQVRDVVNSIDNNSNTIISVFAGRIADTGRDPIPIMMEAREIIDRNNSTAELLWASSRELLNIFHAENCNCDIITVTNDLLKKISMIGKNLSLLSLDTVKMFKNDALSAGFNIL